MPKASTTVAAKAPRRTPPTRRAIENAYWTHVLENGSEPASVFTFAKANGWEEEEFYAHFSTFRAIETSFWRRLAEETIHILAKDPDAAGYDARRRLLAFHYTFFEGLLPHRSRLLARLPRRIESARTLSGLTDAFGKFADTLIAQGRDEGAIAGPSRLDPLYRRALQLHLHWLLDYHRHDTSEKFENTDALIEKSVRFFFDAARWSVVESAVDLARFLAPRLSR